MSCQLISATPTILQLTQERMEMAKIPENPVGASESRLAEEAGYSDDSTAKPIARKKKNTRKQRHGEWRHRYYYLWWR